MQNEILFVFPEALKPGNSVKNCHYNMIVFLNASAIEIFDHLLLFQPITIEIVQSCFVIGSNSSRSWKISVTRALPQADVQKYDRAKAKRSRL